MADVGDFYFMDKGFAYHGKKEEIIIPHLNILDIRKSSNQLTIRSLDKRKWRFDDSRFRQHGLDLEFFNSQIEVNS